MCEEIAENMDKGKKTLFRSGPEVETELFNTELTTSASSTDETFSFY
jgi:hypothetical protein